MPYPTKKLGEVCEIEYGTRVVKSRNEAGQYYVYGGGGKTFTTTDYNRENRVIISRFGMSAHCVRKVAGKFFLNDSGLTLSPKNILELSPKYLDSFLFSIEEKVFNLGRGQAQRNLSIDEFKELEISLPPLPEQKKIVAKLERVLAKINEAKKLRAEAQENTDNLLPAELHKIFSQQHSNILQNARMSSTGKNGWQEKELREIVDEIKSGFACGKQNEVSDGVVHLRTHNIDTERNLNFDKITQIPKDLVIRNAFGLEKGDILFNNTNSTELVGKTALVTEALPYAFSNHLTRIRVNKNKVLSEWMVYVFNTFWKDKYFESICTRWVGQSGINQAALKKFKIPLPPLAEQKKIVARLDSLSEKIGKIKNLQSATQNDFTALEQSVLSKAFTTKQHSNILENMRML